MKYSNLFIPTLREAPQEAETRSHQLMLRAGVARKTAPGEYVMLPMGKMIVDRIIETIERELGENGCEISGSCVHVKKCDDSADSNLRFDWMKALSDDIKSYKMLPKHFFLKSNCIVPSIRPRFGLLKTKCYQGLDGYLFTTPERVEQELKKLIDSLERFFSNFHLNLVMADAFTNSTSHSGKVIYCKNGAGDAIYYECPSCGRRITDHSAPYQSNTPPMDEPLKEVIEIHTPQSRTIEEITAFLHSDCSKIVKTLLYLADGQLVGALLRGDRILSEAKLKKALGCNRLSMADDETVRAVTHAECGFAGPIGLDAILVADEEVLKIRNGVVGANKTDHHKENVNIGRDYKPDIVADIKTLDQEGVCECGSMYQVFRGFTLGRIDLVAESFAESAGYTFINDKGKEDHLCTICYHINLDCLLGEILERNSLEEGLRLPGIIMPFEAVVVAVKPKDTCQMTLAETLYRELCERGIHVLLDDRNESPGMRFKDLELIGIPKRITVGRKAAEGIVEYKTLKDEAIEINAKEVVDKILGE